MSDSVIEIPNEAGWSVRTLESMCSTISRGTAPVYVEHSDVLAIGQRCVTALGFDASFGRPHSSRVRHNVLKPEVGDVLLNSTGTGTIGRSCVFDSPKNFIVDGHVTVLRSAPDQFRGEWLDAILRTSWAQNHLERFCYAGSTNQLELSRTELAATSLPIPSIDEQDDFVRIFRTHDSAIRKTEAIVEKLKQVKQGLLQDLLTRGVDANSELRPSYEAAPELYQESPLGWIPRDWTHSSLEHILAEPTRNGLYKQSSFRGRGPLMVQMGGLFRGEAVDYSTASRVLVTGSELAQFGLAIGDLLFARRSLTFEGAGLCVVVRDLPGRATFESSIVRARLDFSKALPEFVNNYLRGERSSAQRRTFIRQVAVSGVSSADIAQFEVALPKMEEQRLIIDLYAAASQRIEREGEALNKLRQQKSGLIDDLITGRVRVTPLLAH